MLCRQDVLLEFCTDPRFDEDTLFIIFEEDFRFTPDVGDPAWTRHSRRDTSATIMSSMFGPSPPPAQEAASSSAAPAAAASSSAAPPSHNKMPKAKKWAPPVPPNFWNRAERAAEEGYVIQNKASGADWKQTSMFLLLGTGQSVQNVSRDLGPESGPQIAPPGGPAR